MLRLVALVWIVAVLLVMAGRQLYNECSPDYYARMVAEQMAAADAQFAFTKRPANQ